MKFVNRLGMIVLCLGAAGVSAKVDFTRGGQGFLFPDHNSFVNPGQWSVESGTSLEVSYGQQNVSSVTTQTAGTTVAHSGKNWAFGAGGSRAGTTLTDSNATTDSVDFAAGMGLGSRVTLGGRYQRSIDSGQSNSGTVSGAINLNPKGGKGLTFGAGYTTTIGGATNASGVKAGVGYSGKDRNNNFEANFEIPDINTTSVWTASGFFTVAGKVAFLGAGYSYINPSGGTAQHSASARLGAVIGAKKNIDISALGSYSFSSGAQPFIGGALRAAF